MNLLEYKFCAQNVHGQPMRFAINDSCIWYQTWMEHFSNETLAEIISEVKNRSGKKCAIIFGNCQTVRIQLYLLNHTQFTKKFFIIILPLVFNFTDKLADQILGGGGILSARRSFHHAIYSDCQQIHSQGCNEKFNFIPSREFKDRHNSEHLLRWIFSTADP